MKKQYYCSLAFAILIFTDHAFAQNTKLKALLYTKQYSQLELALAEGKISKEDKIG